MIAISLQIKPIQEQRKSNKELSSVGETRGDNYRRSLPWVSVTLSVFHFVSCLSVNVSVFHFIGLSFCLSVCLSVACQSVILSGFLSIRLSATFCSPHLIYLIPLFHVFLFVHVSLHWVPHPYVISLSFDNNRVAVHALSALTTLKRVKNRKLCGTALAENGTLCGHVRRNLSKFAVCCALDIVALCENWAVNCTGRSFLQRLPIMRPSDECSLGGWTFQMTIHDVTIINKRLTRWKQSTSDSGDN
jgi:hypothetical protein